MGTVQQIEVCHLYERERHAGSVKDMKDNIDHFNKELLFTC